MAFCFFSGVNPCDGFRSRGIGEICFGLSLLLLKIPGDLMMASRRFRGSKN